MRLGLSCLVVSMVSLGACAQSSNEADCSIIIRYQGATYSEAGFTKAVGSELGTADQAACGDTGANAERPFFPGDPEQVNVWSIPGRDPANTVAISDSGDSYRVMKIETENEP